MRRRGTTRSRPRGLPRLQISAHTFAHSPTSRADRPQRAVFACGYGKVYGPASENRLWGILESPPLSSWPLRGQKKPLLPAEADNRGVGRGSLAEGSPQVLCDRGLWHLADNLNRDVAV